MSLFSPFDPEKTSRVMAKFDPNDAVTFPLVVNAPDDAIVLLDKSTTGSQIERYGRWQFPQISRRVHNLSGRIEKAHNGLAAYAVSMFVGRRALHLPGNSIHSLDLIRSTYSSVMQKTRVIVPLCVELDLCSDAPALAINDSWDPRQGIPQWLDFDAAEEILKTQASGIGNVLAARVEPLEILNRFFQVHTEAIDG